MGKEISLTVEYLTVVMGEVRLRTVSRVGISHPQQLPKAFFRGRSANAIWKDEKRRQSELKKGRKGGIIEGGRGALYI